MASDQGKAHNDSIYIPFNSNLTWNVLKQPHLLLAGVTGGGKTTFLNYLIIEMKKCEPQFISVTLNARIYQVFNILG